METNRLSFKMKNKKGFTLIELLVCTIILAVVCVIAAIVINDIRDEDPYGGFTSSELFYPEQSKARAQRELVEEMRRANDLKEQEIRNAL